MDEPRKPSSDSELIGDWVEAIEAARKQEEDWRKEAEKAVDTFRGEPESKGKHFNIYHSNVEIVVPSLFNSTPIPDVRRRFSDDDPIARMVADILERALSYCADAYSFDAVQNRAVYDMVVAGRGVTRVRYIPETDDDKITAQKVLTEGVPWERFVRGPAVTWEDVPYIAFEHFLPREEVRKLNEGLVEKIPFTHSAEGLDDDKKDKNEEDIPKQFQRAQVYEIWDKRERAVLFICPDYTDKVILTQPDPFGLTDFFPIARPMHAITPVGSLVPVCSLTIYRDLLEELNDVTRRISKLVKQLRPRAGYVGTIPDVKALTEADDGEIVPLTATDPQLSAGATDVNKWLAWFPLEPTVIALRELLSQRDAVKQTIYEVTGIADLMRGSTDPRETASAQNLKAQFGSVRVKALQAEVARHSRDTYRLKAEIIARHFEWPIISEMTNIKLLPKQAKDMAMQMAQQKPEMAQQIAQQQPEMAAMVQDPAIEEVMEVLRSGMMGYRIDIETDSTIRADLMRSQEQMNMFLQGTAAYMSAIGPAVQQGAIPAPAAVEIYAAFARQFSLGKSAEDALEKLSEYAEKMEGQPNSQAAGEQAKTAADAKAKTEGAQIKAQSDEKVAAAEMQNKLQIEQVKAQSNERIAQLEAQLEAMNLQLKQAEIQMGDQREREHNAAQLNQAREADIRKNWTAQQAAQMKDSRAGEIAKMKNQRPQA